MWSRFSLSKTRIYYQAQIRDMSFITKALSSVTAAIQRNPDLDVIVPETFHELRHVDAKGKEFDFAQYKGRPVLIVNVASKCGYTPQYTGLQELHSKYQERGLAIVGVPCNQFLFQEPGSNEEIVSACSRNYGVTFPVLAKADVNGNSSIALYRYLRKQANIEKVGWNFEKFLIGKNGEFIGHYKSGVEPKDLAKDIEAAL
jgi:glutathione peroxidase-family protein